jgi:mediator of RNA polymerase II transcription subunit 7
MMQAQLAKSRKETQGIKDMKAKVEGLIQGLGQTSLAESEEPPRSNEKAVNIEEAKDVWEELEKQFV